MQRRQGAAHAGISAAGCASAQRRPGARAGNRSTRVLVNWRYAQHAPSQPPCSRLCRALCGPCTACGAAGRLCAGCGRRAHPRVAGRARACRRGCGGLPCCQPAARCQPVLVPQGKRGRGAAAAAAGSAQVPACAAHRMATLQAAHHTPPLAIIITPALHPCYCFSPHHRRRARRVS